MSGVVIKNCAGINNRIDTKRPTLSAAEHVYLAEAVDVDIDDSGGISVRCGRVPLSTVPSHSLFCDGGDFFAVQDRASDSAIYRVNADETLSGVRSGLTRGAFVSFLQVGEKTYYSNGSENGVIEGGVSSPWPVQTEHYGASTSRAFSPAPVASHIAFFNSCWWLAKDKTIFISEPRMPGKYDLFGRRFTFRSDVRMIRPIKTGVWVSDSSRVGFISAAEDFKAMMWESKANAPAHEWSDAKVDLSGSLDVAGECALWSSDDGLCVGTSDARVINLTEDSLRYVKGSSGAIVATDDYIINSVW